MRKHSSPGKQPWDKPPPKKSGHAHLSAKDKRAAKARAKKAGRRYPNLVDNMRQARRAHAKRK